MDTTVNQIEPDDEEQLEHLVEEATLQPPSLAELLDRARNQGFSSTAGQPLTLGQLIDEAKQKGFIKPTFVYP